MQLLDRALQQRLRDRAGGIVDGLEVREIIVPVVRLVEDPLEHRRHDTDGLDALGHERVHVILKREMILEHHRAAGRKRQVRTDGGRVEQLRNELIPLPVRVGIDLQHAHDLAEHAAVRVDDALRLPRRATRVQAAGDIVTRDRHVRRRVRLAADERAQRRAAVDRLQPDQAYAVRAQPLELRAPLRLLRLEKGDRHLIAREHARLLRRREPPVDLDHNGAELIERKLGNDPLRAVARQDRDPAALAHAEVPQIVRRLVDVALQVAIGQPPVLVYNGLALRAARERIIHERAKAAAP